MQALMDFWSSLIGSVADLGNSFLSILQTITWVDAVDVIIVSYLIYKATKLVRETRAQQLVKGILVLAVAYLISFKLGLKTMSFIMANIFQIGILAVLIVFQPELRRALEQVGRSKIPTLGVFSGSSHLDEKEEERRWNKAISVICDSAISLSRTKTGALIVFERQTKLGDIIKTGTVIDSDPSVELVGNIFFPNTPLHDGAMVVRQGKLYAAGCFLPLSDNQALSRELGTRHRAAIGMSENSDAVVLTVSEETGKISIAQNGVLTRNFDFDSLKARLEAELLPEKPSAGMEKKTGFWRVKLK